MEERDWSFAKTKREREVKRKTKEKGCQEVVGCHHRASVNEEAKLEDRIGGKMLVGKGGSCLFQAGCLPACHSAVYGSTCFPAFTSGAGQAKGKRPNKSGKM